MSDRETYRLAPPVVFWWVWLAFVALNVVDYAVQGLPSARFGTVLGAILLLVTGLVYTLALRPRVVAAEDGLTVLNPYRSHFVPWRRITAVTTGQWVEVHVEADGAGPETAGQDRAADAAITSSAGSRTLHCWALYVSVGARRKIAAGPPRPRDELPRGIRSIMRARAGGGTAGADRYAAGFGAAALKGSYATDRAPEEARYLASLPLPKAIATQLDSRASRERARAEGRGRNPAAAADRGKTAATAAWSWPAVAAVAVPAIALVVAAAS